MTTKLTILGCSGGMGGPAMRTTALLLNDNILIDAGSGVGELTLDALAKIDHIFLTHAHLDHILALPLLLDSVIELRKTPIQVHASIEVIDALRKYIFNWTIWPDFSVIPSVEAPCFKFCPFEIDDHFDFGAGQIRALPVNHHVPAVAYEIRTAQGSTVFSGDTGPSRVFKQHLQAITGLQNLIVECAFPDKDEDLAKRSGHFSPSLLATWLEDVECACVHITHLKPAQADQTMQEIAHQLRARQVFRLVQGDVLTL